MAYVFNKLNSALNGEEDQPEGTNIFAQPTDGQGDSQGGESANPNGVPKTSTETDIMSTGGAGSATTSEQQPVQMQAADSRVMKRNVGKVSTPDFAKTMGDNLSKADVDLQAESDTYMAGANTQAGTYGVDDATLGKAVGGDAAAMTQAGNTLRADAVDYDDFNPETQFEFDDVQNLSSSRGLQGLLKNEARGQLSSKELEFDRGILERSPEFLKIREALKGQQSTLAQKGTAMAADNTKAAQGTIDKGILDAKTRAETGLGTIETGLRTANQSQVDERNKHLADLRAAGVPADVAEKVANVKAGLAADYDDVFRMDDMLVNSKVDGKDFVNYAGDASFDDMIDSNEAMKFNNIMQLLGRGGQSFAEGKGAGADYTINEQGLKEAVISDATRNRSSTDLNLNNEQQKIIDAIKGQVEGANTARGSEYETYKQNTLADLQNQYKGMDFSRLDLNQFFGGAGQVGFDNLVSAKDAARLNEIQTALGGKGTYKAGTNQMGKADMNAIQQYLQDNGYKPGMGTKTTPGTVGTGHADKSSNSKAVGNAASKGKNNGDPNDTLKEIVTNPVGTTKSVAKKLTPKKRW